MTIYIWIQSIIPLLRHGVASYSSPMATPWVKEKEYTNNVLKGQISIDI